MDTMKPKHAITFVVALLLSLTSTAQDKCTAQGQAEQFRIEREFSGKRPAKGDKAAELTWATNLQTALAAAAKRAEDCTRTGRPTVTPSATAKIDECLAGVRRRSDELNRRDQGRKLSLQEQTLRRSEDERLQDDYISCTKSPPR
jgi:hypothetical protein